MATATETEPPRGMTRAESATWVVTTLLLLGASFYPRPNTAALQAVAADLAGLAPIVLVAGTLAGLLARGDFSDRVLGWIGNGTVRGVLLASAAGALTPVCGLGVLPLIAVLLRRGLPLAPVMAFWLASPVTDPAMLVVTAGILGIPFAIAKTMAAFGIGLCAGIITAWLPSFGGPGYRHMRADALGAWHCESGPPSFLREAWSNVRLIARWLALALVLEVLLQRHVPDAWIEATLGGGQPASIPLAAVVGAPLYLDGYAALPLARGLVDMGMASGAALALLIAGSAISLYAVVAVISLVRTRVLALYLVLAIAGACASGYVADGLGIPAMP